MRCVIYFFPLILPAMPPMNPAPNLVGERFIPKDEKDLGNDDAGEEDGFGAGGVDVVAGGATSEDVEEVWASLPLAMPIFCFL